MKNGIILSITVAIAIIIGGIYFYNGEINEDIDPIDWCIPGTNLTVQTGETLSDDQNITDEINFINFQVINLATYKGKEVCQAEYVYDEGTLTQYFTKKNDYIAFVYKNSSGEINEIEMNQTSFETNYDDMVWDDDDTNQEN